MTDEVAITIACVAVWFAGIWAGVPTLSTGAAMSTLVLAS